MTPSLDALDPEIRPFVTHLFTEGARLAAGRTLDWPARRQVAFAARAPWRQGGPAMAQAEEHSLPSPTGPFRVRLYRPTAGSVALPALIYLHGGGWCLFDIDTHDRLMREYAHTAGVAVLGVDYAHAPEHPYPAALEQVLAVVRWARAEAGALHVDPERLALGGDSAGANLALAAACVLRDAGELAGITSLLLNYGAFDTAISPRAAALGTPDDLLNVAEMHEFWTAYLGPDAMTCEDPYAVPARAALHGLPPAVLIAGDRDVLAEQSVALAARLAAAGVGHALHRYPGMPHSFVEATAISAQARAAVAAGAAWVGRHAGGAT